MVRLKHYYVEDEEYDKIVSQFHYGSIKTKEILVDRDTIDFVSIPLWFD